MVVDQLSLMPCQTLCTYIHCFCLNWLHYLPGVKSWDSSFRATKKATSRHVCWNSSFNSLAVCVMDSFLECHEAIPPSTVRCLPSARRFPTAIPDPSLLYPSVRLPIYLPIYPIYLFILYPSNLTSYLSMFLFMYLYAHLFTLYSQPAQQATNPLFNRPSNQWMNQPTNQSINLSIYPSICYRSSSPSVHLLQ